MSEIQPRKGRGCFFYGCLTVVVLFLVCAVGLYFGLQYAINRFVEQYTSATPVPVPTVEGTPEEIAAVQERFKGFTEAIRSGQTASPLVLSEKDLNLLIGNTSDLAQFKNHLHVAIEGKKLKGTLSLPLEDLKLSKKLKGRYFNGIAEVKASLQGGVLMVTLDSLEVNGKPVPEHFMAGIRSQNLAKDVYKDQRSVELLRKLDTIEVEDGRVLVKARPDAPPPR